MKEILAWNDIDTIKDENIKKYMLQTKQKATQQQKPWDFKNWGYWVIIDSWSELEKRLVGTHFTLPSIKQGLLHKLELFEEHYGVCEMVYLLDTDFAIGFVIQSHKIPKNVLILLRKYILTTT